MIAMTWSFRIKLSNMYYSIKSSWNIMNITLILTYRRISCNLNLLQLSWKTNIFYSHFNANSKDFFTELSIVILVVMLYCKVFLFLVLKTCYYSVPIIRTANLVKLITTLFIHTVIIINAYNNWWSRHDQIICKTCCESPYSLIGCH